MKTRKNVRFDKEKRLMFAHILREVRAQGRLAAKANGYEFAAWHRGYAAGIRFTLRVLTHYK